MPAPLGNQNAKGNKGGGRKEGSSNDSYKLFKSAFGSLFVEGGEHLLEENKLSAAKWWADQALAKPEMVQREMHHHDNRELASAQAARIRQQMVLEKERHELEMERLRMEMNATKPADESTEEEQDLYDYVDEETEEVAKIYRKNLDTEE